MSFGYYRDELDWLCDVFGTKMTETKSKMYLDTMTAFKLDVVKRAVYAVAKSSKSFPTCAELETACIALRSSSPADQVEKRMEPCQYYSEGESELSKSLCQKTCFDPHYSKMQFNQHLCAWHYMCAYAKAYPDSTSMRAVRGHLTMLKRGHEQRAKYLTDNVEIEDVAKLVFKTIQK